MSRLRRALAWLLDAVVSAVWASGVVIVLFLMTQHTIIMRWV